MKLVAGSLLLILLALASPAVRASHGTPAQQPRGAHDTVEEQIEVPLLGSVKTYLPQPIEKTHGLVLFISGDGGFNLGVIDMARRIAKHSLVVGLSMSTWRKIAEKNPSGCWYPAGDAETIAQVVEKHYGFPRYVPPVLVGYSSGATLVYGILAQAPPEAFAGALSLGFCADLEVARTFCGRGEWKPSYDTAKHKSWLPAHAALTPRPEGAARWIALQGQVDRVCDAQAVTTFVAEVPASRLVPLEKVGHGFSVPRNWGAAFDAAAASLLEPITPWDPLPRPPAAAVSRTPEQIAARLDALDLPLEVVWPEGATAVMVFVSGDGGWAEIDRSVAAALAKQGVAVVGWNTLRYFWRAKTPEEFHSDLARVVEALPELPVFAGGYSFGAEVVPVTFAASKIPRVLGLVLLGPGPFATFEVSPLDWFRKSEPSSPHSVRRVLESAPPVPVLCLESSSGTDSGCPAGNRPDVTVEKLPGGHHFSGDFEGVARRMAAFIEEHALVGQGRS